MSKITYWLWGIAERADWYDGFPKKFWRRLLRYCDKKAGMGKRIDTDDSVQTSPPTEEQK